jgi:hypothetical protein
MEDGGSNDMPDHTASHARRQLSALKLLRPTRKSDGRPRVLETEIVTWAFQQAESQKRKPKSSMEKTKVSDAEQGKLSKLNKTSKPYTF